MANVTQESCDAQMAGLGRLMRVVCTVLIAGIIGLGAYMAYAATLGERINANSKAIETNARTVNVMRGEVRDDLDKLRQQSQQITEGLAEIKGILKKRP